MPLLGNTTSTSTSGSTNSSTSSSQHQTPGTSQSLVAVAVLGALIGVLALLLLAILGRWLFLRSRKVKQTDDPPPFSDEYHHQPDNGTTNRPTPMNEQRHIPQLQPLRSESNPVAQEPQPMKFRRAPPDQRPNTDIHPVVDAVPPTY